MTSFVVNAATMHRVTVRWTDRRQLQLGKNLSDTACSKLSTKSLPQH